MIEQYSLVQGVDGWGDAARHKPLGEPATRPAAPHQPTQCTHMPHPAAHPPTHQLTGKGPRAPSQASPRVESLSKRHTSHWLPLVMPPALEEAWKKPRY